jgi:hypothetical protein
MRRRPILRKAVKTAVIATAAKRLGHRAQWRLHSAGKHGHKS